ncbi:MAG: alpha-amylase family glycosyl hydrolase [Candidatus Hydrogenedentota bacterium]
MKNLFLLFVVLIFFSSLNAQTLLTDMPELIKAEKNVVKSIDLKDYVINLSDKNELVIDEVLDNECEINLDGDYLKIKSENTGFYLIGCTLKNSIDDKAVLFVPFYCVEKKVVLFRFAPGKPVSSVSVAGEFNAWNNKADLLKDENNDGIYELTKELPAGSYAYKFVIDGSQWVPDPNATLKSPDGFGGFNSVIEVGAIAEFKIIPYKRIIRDKNNIEYIFLIENVSSEDINVKALYNNEPFEYIKIYEDRIDDDKYDLYIHIKIVPADKIDLKLWVFDNNGAIGEYRFKEYKETNLPDWRDRVIYFVFTDRFCNNDPANDTPVIDEELAEIANYQGGDFKGIIKKIEEGYFSRLGVDVLWISPVIDNVEGAYIDSLPPHRKFTSYHGYWPKSLTEIEEHFGSKDDLKTLIDVAHSKNIKIIFDIVFNHIHKESDIYNEHPDWFTPLLLPDGTKNLRLFDKYPFTTWFDEFIPSFDYDKEAVKNMMVENAIWWIKEFNIDGFRVDAVKHIPENFFIDLRKEIVREIEIPQNKRFFMVGETIDSRERIKQYIKYTKLDSQFDFPLYWSIRDFFAYEKIDLDRLREEYLLSNKIYNIYQVSPLLGNHDFSRFIAYADKNFDANKEKELAFTKPPQIDKTDPQKAEAMYKKIQFAFGFLLTLNGIPMIYYGDEIGLTGAADPDNRRMMLFEDKWDKYQKATFEKVASLLHLRKDHDALRRGVIREIYSSNELWVIRKTYFNDDLLIVYNNSKTTDNKVVLKADIFDEIIEAPLEPLYGSDGTTSSTTEGITFFISPKSVAIYKIESEG